jgi:hypothetical protein
MFSHVVFFFGYMYYLVRKQIFNLASLNTLFILFNTSMTILFNLFILFDISIFFFNGKLLVVRILQCYVSFLFTKTWTLNLQLL